MMPTVSTRSIVLSFLWSFGVQAQTYGFLWPAGASNSGPYTLLSNVQNYTVFFPSTNQSTEVDLASHKYNHHTAIGYLNGAIYVAHSSACSNEEDSAQQSVAHVSLDRGQTWSAPIQTCPSQSDWTCQTHFHSLTELGARISYPRCMYPYGGTMYAISAIDQIWTNSVGATGYVGLALSACALYTNGTAGPLFRISPADYTPDTGRSNITYDGTLGPPLYAYAKVYGMHGGSSPEQDIQSDWLGWYSIPSVITLVEPSTFSQDGGTQNLYRLWRANGAWFAQMYSTNGGSTWVYPVPNYYTTVPNYPSAPRGLRLNDGRFVLLGNSYTFCRDPLFFAITDTASFQVTNVWALRQGLPCDSYYPPHLTKQGGASYSDVVQVGNYLYISYSEEKETIGFSRVLIPDLLDNNNDLYVPPVNLNIGSAAVGTLRTAP